MAKSVLLKTFNLLKKHYSKRLIKWKMKVAHKQRAFLTKISSKLFVANDCLSIKPSKLAFNTWHLHQEPGLSHPLPETSVQGILKGEASLYH